MSGSAKSPRRWRDAAAGFEKLALALRLHSYRNARIFVRNPEQSHPNDHRQIEKQRHCVASGYRFGLATQWTSGEFQQSRGCVQQLVGVINARGVAAAPSR